MRLAKGPCEVQLQPSHQAYSTQIDQMNGQMRKGKEEMEKNRNRRTRGGREGRSEEAD